MPDTPLDISRRTNIVSRTACSCYALLRVSMAPKSTVPKDLIPVGVVAPTLDFWLKSNRLINRILLCDHFTLAIIFGGAVRHSLTYACAQIKKADPFSGRPVFLIMELFSDSYFAFHHHRSAVRTIATSAILSTPSRTSVLDATDHEST